MRHQTFAVALLTALLAADATAQVARSRDSAGVRIIENSALKDAPVRFVLGDKPLLVVGGLESNPDEEFDHRQGFLSGVQLSTGGLAVIDGSRVHYFDAKGKRIRIVGRKGQGPKEFSWLTSICRTRGDTLVVNDLRNRRISILDDNGRIVRTILQGDNGSAPNNSCLDDGSFVLQRRVGDARNRQNRVTRLRTDGAIVNVAGTYDASGFDMVTQIGPNISASGDALYDGNPYTSEIRVYDTLGTLRRVIRVADRGDRITDAEADERMGWTIPNNQTIAQRTAMMDQRRALPRVALTWPVFYQIVVGTDGTIWVQDYNKKTFAPPDSWTAMDSTGRIVGRLDFPAALVNPHRAHVLSFGRDHVLFKQFDADGAQSLLIYPVIRIDGRSR